MTIPTKTATPGKARERFLIAGEAGYSEYWRRDKSPVEILELAKLLLGIRKIVSYVGRNAGTVVWEGMVGKTDSIELDPAPIIGVYPIPAHRADVAIGAAVREAYGKTEWSDQLKRIALERFDRSPVYAGKYALFLTMAEKIYADLVANRSIFGLYVEKSRNWEIEAARKQFLQPPSFTELLHLWWQMAADREQQAFKREFQDNSTVGMGGATGIAQYYTRPLAVLNSIVGQMIDECGRLPSVTERCEYRAGLYAAAFDQLLSHVKFWVADRKDPFLMHDASGDDLETDQEKDAVKATLVNYADEIEHNLKVNRVDYTDQVKSIVANFNEVARVESNDIVMPSKRCIDNALLYKLKTVLQSVAQRNVSYNRGLPSGRIDRRRLFRAPTSGLVFNAKKTKLELYNDIVLLVDCTGSMAEPNKWAKVEVIYQTLFLALSTYNANARLLAYNERKDTCRLTEIYRQGRFYSVTPHGRTASGEAIIVTALGMRNRGRKPLIVHVTDGSSNWGCGVNDAIKYCDNRNISLLTLGLECDPMNKASLKKDYGDCIQFVDGVEHLPVVFKQLLSSSKFAHPGKATHGATAADGSPS